MLREIMENGNGALNQSAFLQSGVMPPHSNCVSVFLRLGSQWLGYCLLRSERRLMILRGLAALVGLLLISPPGAGAPLDRAMVLIPKVDLVWDHAARGAERTDQESFRRALEGAGFRVNRTPSSGLEEAAADQPRVLVVPAPSAKKLRPGNLRAMLRLVEDGAVLVTDTPTILSEAFGIRATRKRTTVSAKFCRMPDLRLRWLDKPDVPVVDYAGEAMVLYRDSGSGDPIAVQIRRGRGGVIFFSAMFDPHSGYGLSRYPHLGRILLDLGFAPPFFRSAVEAYFDAGYHEHDDIEELAQRWETWGIRAIHANAWDMYNSPPFDYHKLVQAAHRRGILVYAWLQWPYVGRGFWDRYPEWREKNALLKDAKIDFLYLMNFQNPECRRTALSDLQELLTRVEFDGIDIAEFSIAGGVDESLEGPASPHNFVGLNENARAEFKAKKGVDPIELFDKASPHFWKRSPELLAEFYAYRRRATSDLTAMILEQLSAFNLSVGTRLDLLMTIIDNTLHPEFDQLLALDLSETIRNTAHYGFSLQIEDPTDEWAKLPDRYLRLGKRYSRLLNGRAFSIDINFEDCHPEDQVGFPTTVPIGSEVHWLWRYASEVAARVCFYAESQIDKVDWETMPAAMAAGTDVRPLGSAWEITAPRTVFVKMREEQPVTLDGQPWPCRNGSRIMIPSGRHRLAVLPSSEGRNPAGITVLSTTGELIRCLVSAEGLEITVHSDRRCLTRFNGPCRTILVDGREAHPLAAESGNRYLFTPPGQHTLKIR